MGGSPIEIPDTSLDFYSRSAIRDPVPTYRELLDLGPVVRLRRHCVLAVCRYDELRRVLKDDAVFISSKGVTLNKLLNSRSKAADTTLVTDGELHSRLRRHLIAPMRPRALEEIRERLEARAVERIDQLVGRGRFEAMAELASHLPLTIVAELVGLRGAKRARMLQWSKATFNLIGAFNGRALRSLPIAFDMFRFQRTVKSKDLEPGSWIHRLFELRDRNELSHSEALGMVIDYIAPSLDTTIFATGNLLHRLARHPEQWEKLVANPGLVPGAVNESLRIDTVIRAFARVAARDADVGGLTIRAGERVLVVYGAANADERHYPDPERFDITRDARDHMGFGHGVHACAGAALARLELETLLRLLVERVSRLEAGTPTPADNNTLFGFSKLPLTLVPR
jgi:cytochrome P450